MSTPDEVIHQSTRLKIMATLNALNGHDAIDFVALKQLANATDGNLGAHLTTLEKAGYISIDKGFADKKPRTRIVITRDGRRAFEQHVAYLRDVLEQAVNNNNQ
jgi:DNA-binding MarR family transcriptional regulator